MLCTAVRISECMIISWERVKNFKTANASRWPINRCDGARRPFAVERPGAVWVSRCASSAGHRSAWSQAPLPPEERKRLTCRCRCTTGGPAGQPCSSAEQGGGSEPTHEEGPAPGGRGDRAPSPRPRPAAGLPETGAPCFLVSGSDAPCFPPTRIEKWPPAFLVLPSWKPAGPDGLVTRVLSSFLTFYSILPHE